jgi:hypothetical protein
MDVRPTLQQAVDMLLKIQEEKRLTIISRAESYSACLDDPARDLGKLVSYLTREFLPPDIK